jgi:hypothetical protein
MGCSAIRLTRLHQSREFRSFSFDSRFRRKRREGPGHERRIDSNVVLFTRLHHFVPPLLGVCIGLARARVAEACPIEVSGDGNERWQEAATHTSAALSEEARQLCASIIVEVTTHGAVVRLATHDGRLATRELVAPDELLPAVQALTVGVPPAADPVRRDEKTPGKAPGTAAVASRPSDAPPVGDPYASRPLFGAAAGFRMGADRLITPVVGGTISLLQPPFELGLLLRYEAHYVNSAGENQGRPETSGVVFGLQAGLHRELKALAVRAGMLMLVAALEEDGGAQRGRSEVRLGAYVGGVWPSRSTLRLRSDLAFDLVPYNVGRSETNALGESSLPWWGVSFSLGGEMG